ncbi:CMRF35-like molecule 3 isoform X1 [Triplophysa rosa]|uniref:CMRF35-like molecule 3 isoform X1 n=1 Tax=Triplophysa rosa TaxID=992332 RepID=UPI002545FA07|nr:CMRF35-like molecule 3 isoform X1 [Triplophysa rosa]XP_057188561.1 CMRF35-like molecule 3 isoform X1 [Triplophysa rosa]
MIEYERRMKMMLTFTLLMIPGALSFSVTGYTGGAVTITCPYDRGYTRNEKYFCKGQKPVIPRPGWCSDVIRTDVKDEWVESERFSLYDDTTASVFNVTITDLNEHDSDTYQCAVDIDYRKDIYTEVKLTVREEQSFEENTHPSTPPPSSTIETLSTTLNTRPSASDSPSASSDILSHSSVIVIIIIVCVLVLLIFTGLLLFILLYCRRCSAQDADSDGKMSHSGPGIYESVTEITLGYEEIKDIRRLTGTITDCNTTPLPTIPSDAPHTVYHTVQLPTIPCDTLNIFYATPQFPTNGSDACKTVYDTVQLPTILSDAPNTVYATVQ